MAEKELVLDVTDLNVVSVTCTSCNYGTIFDLEKIKPNPEAGRSVASYLKFKCNCAESVGNEVDTELQTFWSTYQKLKSMPKQRVEFRVRPSLTKISTF
jgi:hypothetical protein